MESVLAVLWRQRKPPELSRLPRTLLCSGCFRTDPVGISAPSEVTWGVASTDADWIQVRCVLAAGGL